MQLHSREKKTNRGGCETCDELCATGELINMSSRQICCFSFADDLF